MDNMNVEKFEKLWEKFSVKFKGMLLNEANKQTLTHPLACILLRDARLAWESEYDEGGRWLRDYQKSQPEKAERIYAALLGMTLEPVSAPKEIPELAVYAAPVAGAAAGLAVSSMLGASPIVLVVCAAAPALLMFSSVSAMRTNQKNQGGNHQIDQYMLQLNGYKDRVLEIMNGE